MNTQEKSPAALLGGVLQQLPDGVVVLDGTGEPRLVNAAAARLLCRLARGARWLPPELDRPAGTSAIVSLHDLGGRELAVELTVAACPEAGPGGRLIHLRDITGLHRRQRALEQLVYRDPLTGLYNRRGLERHAAALVGRGGEGVLAAYYVDVNRLKQINDEAGHATGDAAIVETARLLCEVFAPADLKARVGGDEFVVLSRQRDPVRARQAVTRLRRHLARRNARNGRPYTLSLSVGFTWCRRGESPDLHRLLDEADTSMYRTKREVRAGAAM